MRHIVTALLLILSLSRIQGQEPALLLAQDYGSLIYSATSYYFRGIAPSQEEIDAAERVYRQLEAEKDQVTAWIIASLKQQPKAQAYHYSPATYYGAILWRFGPESVMKLEPDILQAENEQIRLSGVYIIGYGRHDAPEVAMLTLKVLQRDASPQVKADAIRALANLHALSAVPEVVPYLKAEESIVRKAAVQFFWSNEIPQAVPALTEILTVEQDPDTGFWLAWTLCRNHYPDHVMLLTSPQAGIRAGALHYLAGGLTRLSAEEIKTLDAQVETEKDTVCRFELAGALARQGNVRCLRLFIGILNGTDDPERPYERSRVRTAASSELGRLTGQHFGITDEDRAFARLQRSDILAGMAARYSAWWDDNRDRICWDPAKSRFVITIPEP